MDAILQFYQAAAVDWSDPQSVMTICGPQAGATIPSDAAITAGNLGTGAACTSAFLYTVGAVDQQVVTGYAARA